MTSFNFVQHLICLLPLAFSCHSLLLPNISAQDEPAVHPGFANSSRDFSLSDTRSYKDCVEYGSKLYTQLQNHEFEDKLSPLTVEQLRTSGWSIPRWPAKVENRTQCLQFLSGQGIDSLQASSGDDYHRVKAELTGDISYYDEIYSPKNKLIVVDDIRRNPMIPGPHWSDMTYAIWQDTCVNSGVSTQNLQFIIQYVIMNDVTLNVINEISRRLKSKGPWTVYPYGATADHFRAILGTPNGYGTVYLLGEHETSLGHRTIAYISYYLSESRFANLVFKLLPETGKPDSSGKIS